MQIQVQYVNPPPSGEPWKSSIRDTNNVRYSVPEPCLGMFQVGGVYEITYEGKTSQSGSIYNVITSVNGQPLQTGNQAPRQQPPKPPPPPASLGAPTPSSVTQATPPILSNLLHAAIEAGLVKQPNDLEEWARAVRMAVQVYFNPSSYPERTQTDNPYDAGPPDPHDEIPF